MNRIIILTVFALSFSQNTTGQSNVEWAGLDGSSCGEKGYRLGVDTPCEGCCFQWSPAEELDFPDVQRPIAKPKKDGTIFHVIVTDENLSWKKSDDVKVNLDFGEMTFLPDYLSQGTSEIVLAKLMKNAGNYETTWSIEGDDLGCSIAPNGSSHNLATVSPGGEFGKITVKVARTSDAECYFTETLPVNKGVKDLEVSDLNNPERKATTGQTLYLVSNDPVDWKARLVAIPNGAGFKPGTGIPDYKQDLYASPMPLDEDADQIVEDIAIPGGKPSDYIAGEFPGDHPFVTVVRQIPAETPTQLPSLAFKLNMFWQSLREALNFEEVNMDEPPLLPTELCPSQTPFEFTANFGVSSKSITVEKYADPNYGARQECSIDAGFNVTGKVYHPQFTRHLELFGVGACTELYASLEYVHAIHMGMFADESMAEDDWQLADPQMEIGLTGSVGFTAILFSGTGYNLQASGSGSLSCKGFVEYTRATQEIIAYAKLTPLTIKIDATIVNEANLGEQVPIYNIFSKEIVLYKPLQSTPVVLHKFED